MIKKNARFIGITVVLTFLLLVSSGVIFSGGVYSQNLSVTSTCMDGVDNDSDGRADYAGVLLEDGTFLEPDPSCLKHTSSELGDSVSSGGLVPCVNKCSFSDVFKLLNNVLKFLITIVIIPVFVLMLMYTGYEYLMARGRPGMHVKLKNRLWKMFLGFVLILSAWLIVRTFLSFIGYDQGALFLE